MNKRDPIYLIYRSKETKKIMKYSVIRIVPPDIEHHIAKFNSDEKNHTVEIVYDQDHLSLIVIAEENSLIKKRDLDDIETAIDGLQTEIYNLKDRIKETK